MYAGVHAKIRANQPAFIMAQTGVAVTYAELEQRTNRLAHFLRSRGLKRLDHYAIFMENNDRYVESCGAGERAGLYFTCVNSFLTAGELAYIVNNSESRVLIVSEETRATALTAIGQCPKVEAVLVVDGSGVGDRILNLDEATAGFPATPIADETIGTAMSYSSGTTGRPKGILRPLPDQPPSQQLPLFDFLPKLRYGEGLVYLSPLRFTMRTPSVNLRSATAARNHGAFRRRADFTARRTVPDNAHPARADDVLAHAETARGHAVALRSVVARGDNPRRRALSGPSEGADDRVVGTDHS
jgi:hypothetical protein